MTALKLKSNIPEIEKEIDARLAVEEEIYDLDDMDRQEIRDEVYQSHGYDRDPFFEEGTEDETDEDEAWELGIRPNYSYMSAKLAEIGMTERDFF